MKTKAEVTITLYIDSKLPITDGHVIDIAHWAFVALNQRGYVDDDQSVTDIDWEVERAKVLHSKGGA